MQNFIFLTCQLTDLCGAKVCLKVAVRRDGGKGLCADVMAGNPLAGLTRRNGFGGRIL